MFQDFRSLYLKLKVIFDFVFFPVNFIYEKVEDLGYYLRDEKGYQQVNIAFSAGLPFFIFGCFAGFSIGEYFETVLVFLASIIVYFLLLKLKFKVDEHSKKTLRILAWFKIFLGFLLLSSVIYDSTNILLTSFFSILITSFSAFWLWLALDEEPPKRKKYEEKKKSGIEIMPPLTVT